MIIPAEALGWDPEVPFLVYIVRQSDMPLWHNTSKLSCADIPQIPYESYEPGTL